MSNPWLTSLMTKTPQAGYELAVKMARVAIKMTQPDDRIRKDLRVIYEKDANALIAASAVVAMHYQTIAVANNYWKD